MANLNTIGMAVGWVTHCRHQPKKHAFKYGLFDVLLPVHDWPSGNHGLLSVDKPNVLCVYAKNYGPRDGSSLLRWIQTILAKETITTVENIWLLTMPKVAGYAFNPVSFWFCTNAQGELLAVLCEVNNTFGEHHNYLVAHSDSRPINTNEWLSAQKVFHVSPFFKIEGHYEFKFDFSKTDIAIHIRYFDARGLVFTAQQSVNVVPSRLSAQLKALARFPLVTLKVVAAILWHALRLWAKKIPIFTKPNPPTQEVTR